MKRNARASSKSKSGFTLVELLLILSLLAPFALIAGRLFVASFKTSRDAAGVIERTVRFDSALSQLRADVWSASQLNGPSPSQLALGPVQWSTDDHQNLVRTDDSGAKRSWPVGQAKFTISGPLVVTRVTDLSGHTDEATMISQVLTAKGEAR